MPPGILLLVQRSGFFHHFEGFDNVADLDVVEVFETDAALEVADHFAGIVLMTLEGSDLAGVDHHAVAQEAGKSGTGELAVSTTPSRRRRARAERVSLPSVTIQPAMTPTLGTEKVSRTSA